MTKESNQALWKLILLLLFAQLLQLWKNKKDTTSGNVTLLRRMKNQENVCAMLQGLSRVLSALTKHFISFKAAFGTPAVARTSSLWMLECCKANHHGEVFHYCWPPVPTAPVFIHCCWPLWLFMGGFPHSIAKIEKMLPPVNTCFCFSAEPVIILTGIHPPSHFHKAFPVLLSFKVADEEVMKTRVVNCLQAKAVFPLKLTS